MSDKLIKLLGFCVKWYSKKKFEHALRVASYAYYAIKLDTNYIEDNVYLVALAHDLLEDTECSPEALEDILGEDLFSSVITLTKDNNLSYEEYIKKIIDSEDKVAIVVKRADIKDHMTQLTDKLNEKYIPILHYFL